MAAVRREEKYLQRDLKKLSFEEAKELREHLEGEDVRLREMKKNLQIALKKQAEEVSTDTLDKIRTLLENEERVAAAKIFSEAKAKVRDLKKQAPVGGAERQDWARPRNADYEIKSLQRQFEERLSDQERFELRLGMAEAEVMNNRTERGDQQAFEALSPKQKNVAQFCEASARMSQVVSSQRESSQRKRHQKYHQQNVEKAAKLVAGLDAEQRQEIAEVVGTKGAETFQEVVNKAQQHGQQDRDGGQQDRDKGNRRGGRSRGRGGFGRSR